MINSFSQIHFLYDFARNTKLQGDYGKNISSISYENFKPDTFGYTYYTIDFFYVANQIGYMELSRNINIPHTPFAIHAEFDGGLCIAGVINDAALLGLSLPLDLKNGKSLEFQILAKKFIYYQYKEFDGQFTIVFNFPICKKFLFNGYFDIWSQKLDKSYNFDPKAKRNFVILSEPQFCYNINKTFTIESRLRISQHFCWNIKPDGTHEGKANPDLNFFPCLGLKINL